MKVSLFHSPQNILPRGTLDLPSAHNNASTEYPSIFSGPRFHEFNSLNGQSFCSIITMPRAQESSSHLSFFSTPYSWAQATCNTPFFYSFFIVPSYKQKGNNYKWLCNHSSLWYHIPFFVQTTVGNAFEIICFWLSNLNALSMICSLLIVDTEADEEHFPSKILMFLSNTMANSSIL